MISLKSCDVAIKEPLLAVAFNEVIDSRVDCINITFDDEIIAKCRYCNKQIRSLELSWHHCSSFYVSRVSAVAWVEQSLPHFPWTRARSRNWSVIGHWPSGRPHSEAFEWGRLKRPQDRRTLVRKKPDELSMFRNRRFRQQETATFRNLWQRYCCASVASGVTSCSPCSTRL